MTPPPTDRARALIKQCLVCDHCNSPWPCQCGGLGTVALDRAESAIAQLLRDTEAEVRERCAKIAETHANVHAHNAHTWGLLTGCGELIAAAIREAKP